MGRLRAHPEEGFTEGCAGDGRPTQMIPPVLTHTVEAIQDLKQSKGCTVAVQVKRRLFSGLR
jgi:hypothetical protein